jgi:hypothetical protein
MPIALDKVTEVEARGRTTEVIIELCKAVARLNRSVKELEKNNLQLRMKLDPVDNDPNGNTKGDIPIT